MRLRSLLLPAVAAIVVAVVAVIVRNQPPAQPAKAGAATTIKSGRVAVAISNYAFVPPKLSVRVGTHVTWTNHDATAHTATADQGSFDTGTINPHASRTIDFNRPGTYTYHCSFHAFMVATITVKP